MALTNVSTGGGILTSITDNGQAISEARVQQLVDTDYTKIKNMRVIHKLRNISTKLATTDTLNDRFLTQGEELLIRKSDGTYHEFTVGPLTPVDSLYSRVMTSDSAPLDNVYATGGYGYQAFDTDTTSWADVNGVGGYLRYRTENDVPITVTKYYFHGHYAKTVEFQGSNNGVEWDVLDTVTGLVSPHYVTRTVPTPAPYFYYRLYVTSTDSSSTTRFYTWDLYVAGWSCDTSAVTQGEVPNRVYRMQDTITVNETLALEDKLQRDYRYGYDGENLKIYAMYPEVDFAANREIITQVDFKQELNQIVEMTGEIYAITYIKANDTHTANNVPNTIGTISVSGADAASVPDAWKLMDGDWTTDSMIVPTGVGGVVDLAITYSFVTPIMIYATKIAYSGAAQSMKNFTIEGSNDGTNWTVLYTKVDQGLTVPDLIITKALDTYGTYLHYKLAITAGATENDNIVLKEFSFMTEQPV